MCFLLVLTRKCRDLGLSRVGQAISYLFHPKVIFSWPTVAPDLSQESIPGQRLS